MKKKIGIFIICTLLISATITISSYNAQSIPITQGTEKTYYVSKTGNDANPGTISSPWRHINYAVNKLIPGDTLLIRGGTYNELIRMLKSGTSSAYITIKNYPGETPILDATGFGWSSAYQAMFEIGDSQALWTHDNTPTQANYIKISGLKFQNFISGYGGLLTVYFSHYVYVENCTFSNCKSSAFAACGGENDGSWEPPEKTNHIYLLNNHFTSTCCQEVIEVISIGHTDYAWITGNIIDQDPGYGRIGICFPGWNTNIVVAYNDVARSGMNIKMDAQGSYMENFWVHHNYCHGVGVKANSCMIDFECGYTGVPGTIKNVYIYNNIFASSVHGIASLYEGCAGTKQNIQIINNVIDVGSVALGLCGESSDFIWEDTIVRNNIIYGGSEGLDTNRFGSYQPLSELTVDHNFFISGCSNDYSGTDYLTSNPMFVNRANDDYHLQSTSPAIGFGINTDDLPIYFDSTTEDIKAYEDSSSKTTTTDFIDNPPNKPKINGKIYGKSDTEYEYKFVSTDPEEDKVIYCINWGDDTKEVWIGSYKSGLEASFIHKWSEKGNYIIKVKARDVYGAESDWATFEISIINNPITQLRHRILERFPFLEKILNQIL